MEFLHTVLTTLRPLGILESWNCKFCVLVQLL